MRKTKIVCTIGKVCRQMNLRWGGSPLLIRREDSADALFADAVETARKAGYIESGDRVVITAGVPLGISGNINRIRVVEVE